METEVRNKSVIYSLKVSGKVKPSFFLYATSDIRARLTIGASKSIETSLGFRQPSFISFHAFSTILLSWSIATSSDTPKLLVYASTLVREVGRSRSNYVFDKPHIVRIHNGLNNFNAKVVCYFVVII